MIEESYKSSIFDIYICIYDSYNLLQQCFVHLSESTGNLHAESFTLVIQPHRLFVRIVVYYICNRYTLEKDHI